MPNIVIHFGNPLNEAVQADSKDIAYYADTNQTTFGDGSTVQFADSVVRLGPIVDVNYVNNTDDSLEEKNLISRRYVFTSDFV